MTSPSSGDESPSVCWGGRRHDQALFADTIERGLHEMEDRPWPEFGNAGKPITAPTIARLLRPFGIRPRSVRIGPDTAKGYRRDQFAEAWGRYLTGTPPQAVTPSQPVAHAKNGESEAVTPQDHVTDANDDFLASQAECDGVTPTDPPLDATDEQEADLERIRGKFSKNDVLRAAGITVISGTNGQIEDREARVLAAAQALVDAGEAVWVE